MKDLGKMAKYAKNALINYDSYIQADADAKNYQLDKYRAKVQAAASDSDADENVVEGKDWKVFISCAKNNTNNKFLKFLLKETSKKDYALHGML